jgi:hypothetical protein
MATLDALKLALTTTPVL